MDGKMGTYSSEAKDNLITYGKDQEAHHKTRTFREEIMDLLGEHEVDFDVKYLD